MGSRYLPGALIGASAILLAGPGFGQTVPRNDPRQLRHVMAVRAERTERLLDAWEKAETSERRLVVDLLAREGAGTPLGSRPSVHAIDLATRLLAGEIGPDGATPLQRFAASLDLQVIPGSFGPVEEPDADDPANGSGSVLGTPITAGLYALPGGPSLDVGELEVSLFWERLGEAGTDRIRARSEPFRPSSFVNPGVPLYLRAPLSGPGLWALTCELSDGLERVRGVPVPVECIAGERSSELVDLGLRTPRAFPGVTLRELLPGSEPVAVIEPDSGPAELHLLLLAPFGEAAATPFVGRGGELWTRFAQDHSARVWSCEIRSGAREAFFALLKSARSASPDAELVVVARGDAALALHAFMLAADERPDRVVLACELERTGAALDSIPTLLITPLAIDESADPPWLTRVQGEREALFEERRLPGHLEAWLGI